MDVHDGYVGLVEQQGQVGVMDKDCLLGQVCQVCHVWARFRNFCRFLKAFSFFLLKIDFPYYYLLKDVDL